MDTKELLFTEGIDVRVVSMPSMFLYDLQSDEYKETILPANVKTLAVEMGSTMPWYKYSRNVYGIDTFGLSAAGEVVMDELGFTKEKLAKHYKSIK